jgi:hypothetical protein
MPRYAGVGCRLRRVFEDIPPSILPRPMPPVRLTSDEARLNYTFVNDGGDSVEILHRVRRGLKPVGTVLVKLQDVRYSTDRAAVGAIKGFGLG